MPRMTYAERAERDTKAVNLRRAGASYEEIARTLKYSNSGHAWKAVTKALGEVKREAAEGLLTLELERLDRLQRAAWQNAVQGDEKAISTVLKVLDHRAKLTGLYTVQPAGDQEAIKTAFAGFLGAVAAHPLAALPPAGASSIHGHAAGPADEPLEAAGA